LLPGHIALRDSCFTYLIKDFLSQAWVNGGQRIVK
jgi:hypothetical protein